MTVLISVEAAVEAYVQRVRVASADQGKRTWWRRCPWSDNLGDGHFAYWLAVNDDEEELWFDLVYHGAGDDLLPDGFEDFTLYIGGGKHDADDLFGPGPEPSAPMNVKSRRRFFSEEGRLLEFVTRLPAEGDPTDWLTRPDVFLRCSECAVVNDVIVAVADPEQECLCGALSRRPDGTLQPPDDQRYFTAVYRLA